MSGCISIGSDLLLVQAVFLQWHHPSAEQVDADAAIHRSLEGLQFVDLSFGLPIAPRFQHSVPSSLQVLAGTVNLSRNGRNKAESSPARLCGVTQLDNFAPCDHRLGTKRSIVG